MKYILFVPISIIIILLTSCEKDGIYIEGIPGDVVGSWIEPEYNDTLLTYRRSKQLLDDKPGFTFRADGSLVERKNSGWCGTPPIAYSDFDGTWTLNDSIIDLSVDFWGGEALLKWKIISVTETAFSFAILSREYLYEE